MEEQSGGMDNLYQNEVVPYTPRCKLKTMAKCDRQRQRKTPTNKRATFPGSMRTALSTTHARTHEAQDCEWWSIGNHPATSYRVVYRT
mmetsp:Transcript_26148/g.61368  ORF Transcript_26148/g.61368 Transcript_26148/m.61368 type:complete len:88 (-) Transcript_26148:137-400(-)